MPKIGRKRRSQDALERVHGKEGRDYLEHLRDSSSNPYLQRAIEQLMREAEEQAAVREAIPRRAS